MNDMKKYIDLIDSIYNDKQYLKEEKTKSDKFVPPKQAQKNAQKVLDYREKYGDEVDAMTRTGWTRANQLANGEELSYDIVKRISQFARHRKNAKINSEHKGEPWKDAGYVAWMGWGGDAGIDWAQRIVDQVENNDE